MAAQYAHLHNMTNNPTKYESNPASGYREVAVTRILMENSLSPITPTKIIKSTWRHSMHIYTSWPTILLNMKAIRRVVTEEKPWQEQDWRTGRRVKNIIPHATKYTLYIFSRTIIWKSSALRSGFLDQWRKDLMILASWVWIPLWDMGTGILDETPINWSPVSQ